MEAYKFVNLELFLYDIPFYSLVQINLLRPCQLHGCSLSHAYNRQTLHSHSIKLRTMAQFSEQNKVKMQMSILRKRLWEAAPDSLKDFPWKKAEDTVLQQLLLLGQKALKWSFITLFILSSVSDVIFCISRNKELMIPFGLFVGCMMADFLKETSRELFPNSEVYFLLYSSHPSVTWLLMVMIYCVIDFLFNRKWVWSSPFWALVASLSLWSSCPHFLLHKDRHFFCMLPMVDWCKFCGCGKVYWKEEMDKVDRISFHAKGLPILQKQTTRHAAMSLYMEIFTWTFSCFSYLNQMLKNWGI